VEFEMACGRLLKTRSVDLADSAAPKHEKKPAPGLQASATVPQKSSDAH